MPEDCNVTWDLLESFDPAGEIEYLGTAGDIVQAVFRAMPYTEGVCQFVLNSVVLLSIFVILRRRDATDEKLAFIFIANLAVSDLLQFIVQTLFALFRKALNDEDR